MGAQLPNELAGTTAGTVEWYLTVTGPLMVFTAFFNGYENASGAPQTITLPQDFVFGGTAMNIGVGTGGTNIIPRTSGGAAISFSETTWGTGTATGTQNGRTAVGFSSAGHVSGAIHSFDLPFNNSGTCTGWFTLFGF